MIKTGKLALLVWRDRFHKSEDAAPFDHREIYFDIEQGGTMLAAGMFAEWRIVDPGWAGSLVEFVETAGRRAVRRRRGWLALLSLWSDTTRTMAWNCVP
jgi:hypothetical protein